MSLIEKITQNRFVAVVQILINGTDYKPTFFVKEEEIGGLQPGTFRFVGDFISSPEQEAIVQKELDHLASLPEVKRAAELEDMLLEYRQSALVDRTY